MVLVGGAIDERFTELMNEAAPFRDMQTRRDAWTLFQRQRASWLEGIKTAWQRSLTPPVAAPKKSLDLGFELLGTEVVENKIMTSRLVQGLAEKVSTELNDLWLRVKHLEGSQELAAHDVLRPEVLMQVLVEQWIRLGLAREAWALVNEAVLKVLIERFNRAYADANAFLIQKGVMPTIELKDRVKVITAPAGKSRPPASSAAPELPDDGPAAGWSASSDGARATPDASRAAGVPAEGGASSGASAAFRGRLGWGPTAAGGAASAAASSGRPSAPHTGARPSHPGSPPGERYASGYGAADETRMMTSSTPLARARNRALGVMGQLKRLLVGTAGAHDDTGAHPPAPPSPALAAALVERSAAEDAYVGGDTVLMDFSPAGVLQAAGELRRRASDLKGKATTQGEKATIEIVALMFQAILQEDRIPPGIRVWFARLQMPVLRVALAEPDFFSTLNHPARLLIDRMGSCVMGFDSTSVNSKTLLAEVKRVVQVVEQYPETGKRVYQLVYDEFQKFMAQFLTGSAATKKVVSVAQQVEQKETLTIQYTIEMRNMLKDMPVREEIREFLFKVWAEVLAVVAVRKGPRHLETVGFKKAATDLVWAASAKPNRSDRARVIKDLPKLLEKLRTGMTLLGLPSSQQEAHLKTVSDTLADAFLSKTQAVPAEQIQAMAERLESLEDFVSEDGMGDLPLDAESIELMLGVDADTIVVIADGGSKPSAAMLAWAQELQLGSWFTLDHNSRVLQVQLMWRSDRKHLHLLSSVDGHSYLIQAGRLAAYLQAGLLLPQEEETLTVRATRDALGKLEANPERLLS